MHRREVRESMTVDGVKLHIVAFELLQNRWELSIEHEARVISCWDEFFASAQDALAAGRLEVNSKGGKSFLPHQGVVYLSGTCRPKALPLAIKLAIAHRRAQSAQASSTHTIGMRAVPQTSKSVLAPVCESDETSQGGVYHLVIPLGNA